MGRKGWLVRSCTISNLWSMVQVESWAQSSLWASHPKMFFPKDTKVVSMLLHGFSGASEQAYAGLVYLRMVDSAGGVHTSLVMSKTKVAPIKWLTIPRLELCGAHVLTQILHHSKKVFSLSLKDIFVWTDSTIVLNWLVGSPCRFKIYVGNRVSSIVELIPPDRWNHVNGLEKPADCASRSLFPLELLNLALWWDGLRLSPDKWPKQSTLPPPHRKVVKCAYTRLLFLASQSHHSIISPVSLDWFELLLGWCILFAIVVLMRRISPELLVPCPGIAKLYWISLSQRMHFAKEVEALEVKAQITQSSSQSISGQRSITTSWL